MSLLVIEPLEFRYLVRWGLHLLQQLVHGIEVAQRFIVLQSNRQMRDGVARLQRHRGEIPCLVLVAAPEGVIEHVAPIVDERFQKTIRVEFRVWAAASCTACIVEPVRSMLSLHPAFNERRKTLLKVE